MSVGVAGVILAGGAGRRLGGADKALLPFNGRPLLAHVLDRVRPQVDHLLLSANGDPTRFSDYDLPVLPDVLPGRLGPLSGILTGLEWAAHTLPGIAWVASFSVDTPDLPTDLVRRLLTAVAAEGADLACARSPATLHPVLALWPVASAKALRQAMTEEHLRAVHAWAARFRVAAVSWDGPDPFVNLNTPADFAGSTEDPGARKVPASPSHPGAGEDR